MPGIWLIFAVNILYIAAYLKDNWIPARLVNCQGIRILYRIDILSVVVFMLVAALYDVLFPNKTMFVEALTGGRCLLYIGRTE